MKQFKDRDGRVWHLRLDIPTMRRIRDVTGVDLTAPLSGRDTDGATFRELTTDLIRLVDVLEIACASCAAENPQLAEGEEFGSVLNEASLAAATNALVDEFVDFFQPDRRRALRKLINLTRQKLESQTQQQLTDEQLEKIAEQQARTILQSTSGS